MGVVATVDDVRVGVQELDEAVIAMGVVSVVLFDQLVVVKDGKEGEALPWIWHA